MKIVGMDVGSTTVKVVLVEDGQVVWQTYHRHNTRQAEKVRDFLRRMEAEAGLAPGKDSIVFTPAGGERSKQVFMQSACSGGTGTFVEKTARRL